MPSSFAVAFCLTVARLWPNFVAHAFCLTVARLWPNFIAHLFAIALCLRLDALCPTQRALSFWAVLAGCFPNTFPKHVAMNFWAVLAGCFPNTFPTHFAASFCVLLAGSFPIRCAALICCTVLASLLPFIPSLTLTSSRPFLLLTEPKSASRRDTVLYLLPLWFLPYWLVEGRVCGRCLRCGRRWGYTNVNRGLPYAYFMLLPSVTRRGECSLCVLCLLYILYSMGKGKFVCIQKGPSVCLLYLLYILYSI